MIEKLKPWTLAVALVAAGGLAACDGGDQATQNAPEREAPPVTAPAEPAPPPANQGGMQDPQQSAPERQGQSGGEQSAPPAP